jgi:HSP20 family protein
MDFREILPFGRERRGLPTRRSGDVMEGFQREMNRLFDDFFRNPAPFGGAQWPLGGAMPRVDVEETDTEYQVSAELPGIDEKDVNLTLTDNVLMIRGEKKAEREEKEKNYYVSERSFGSFQRAIPLPTEVAADKVEASFKNGVLTVRLPKTPEAEAKTRRIEVKRA